MDLENLVFVAESSFKNLTHVHPFAENCQWLPMPLRIKFNLHTQVFVVPCGQTPATSTISSCSLLSVQHGPARLTFSLFLQEDKLPPPSRLCTCGFFFIPRWPFPEWLIFIFQALAELSPPREAFPDHLVYCRLSLYGHLQGNMCRSI